MIGPSRHSVIIIVSLVIAGFSQNLLMSCIKNEISLSFFARLCCFRRARFSSAYLILMSDHMLLYQSAFAMKQVVPDPQKGS